MFGCGCYQLHRVTSGWITHSSPPVKTQVTKPQVSLLHFYNVKSQTICIYQCTKRMFWYLFIFCRNSPWNIFPTTTTAPLLVVLLLLLWAIITCCYQSGMGLVHKTANFHGSETDFPQKKKLSAGKRNWWYKKERKRKQKAPGFSSAPNFRGRGVEARFQSLAFESVQFNRYYLPVPTPCFWVWIALV